MREIASGICFQIDFRREKKEQKETTIKASGRGKNSEGTTMEQKERKKIKLWVIDKTILSIKHWGCFVDVCFKIDFRRKKKRTEGNKQQKRQVEGERKAKGLQGKREQKKRKKIKLWVIDETILSIKYWGWLVDAEGFILPSFLCAVANSKTTTTKIYSVFSHSSFTGSIDFKLILWITGSQIMVPRTMSLPVY